MSPSRVCVRALFLALAAFPTAALACPGDCNGDGAVGVNELTLAVNVALERLPAAGCAAADLDEDDRVVVAELISAVRAALLGCPPPPPTPTVAISELRRVLQENRQRWELFGLHSYRYSYFRSCFCIDPSSVEIEVRNDEIFSIRDLFGGEVVVPQDPNAYLTIPRLFALIDEALDFAELIDVQYAADSGAPSRIRIDYSRDLADDEIDFRVADLRALADDACRDSADCVGPGERCLEPGGFIGCGLCQNLDVCGEDGDCAGDLAICAPARPQSCSCAGPVLVCQPGCAGDTDCAAGESCAADHRCRPTSCSSGGECPLHFDCDERDSTCGRRACVADGDCADLGYCVSGLCFAELGNCAAPPP